jgi:hypothetical protein
MNIAIEKYIDKTHRSQVVNIWKSVFRYKEARAWGIAEVEAQVLFSLLRLKDNL